MRYSFRIEQAIRAAAILHEGQVRKGSVPYPYITHSFAVAMIVSDYVDAEDVIVAALLHDTLEDSDYTVEELNEDFGHTVAALVEAVTKPDAKEHETWVHVRKRYLKQLRDAPHDALIIAAADRIHNMRSMVETYYGNVAGLTADFGGSLEERLTMYQEMSNVFNRNLRSAILTEFNHVFKEFKQFIIDCEAARDS